jgi:Serine/threonine protein kinase
MEIKDVDAGGPPWNPRHEGIPVAWGYKGEGGNAHVWTDGTYAIKRLKPGASKEPVARFAREARLMAGMVGKTEPAIVPVVAVRKRLGELEIVMELFEGNLEEIIGEFAGQPGKAADALLVIVQTLIRLAARPLPVHHRDIKPENLLYRLRDGKIQLALSDFGCAYLAADEQLTSTNCIVGAWAYRPPEYSLGRVAAVNEKADVFSIGKVLWAMVNGQQHIVFPGPVWFQDDFDLARQFPDAPGIHHTMVLVAQACNMRPEKRPTLSQLAGDMNHLISPIPQAERAGGEDRAYLKRHKKALREIHYQQRYAFMKQFVHAIRDDFVLAIGTLNNSLPTSALFRRWLKGARNYKPSPQALVDHIAQQASQASSLNVSFQNTRLIARFLLGRHLESILFLVCVEDLTYRHSSSELMIFGSCDGLRAEARYPDGHAEKGPYQRQLMARFLKKAMVQRGGKEY